MISCGHCGDRHATVAEVRSCSAEPGKAMRADEPTATTEDRTGPGAAARRSPTRGPIRVSAPAPVALLPDWAHLAGPASLARNLLVLPGQPAVGPWLDCPRIVVDGAPDGPAKVRAARRDRERVVIELAVPLPEADPILSVDYWHLAPETDLEGEVLRHLVLTHAVDARDPAAPVIAEVSAAVAAGGEVRTAGPGDIDTPSGPAWVDGGPLDWFEPDRLGAPVVPAAHLRIGSLSPLRVGAPEADLAPDQLVMAVEAPGSSRRPGRARLGCSPNASATWCETEGSNPRRSAWSPSTSEPAKRCRNAPAISTASRSARSTRWRSRSSPGAGPSSPPPTGGRLG